MAIDPHIDDFTRRDMSFRGKTKPVLVTGTTGPAVIVIHEVYGFTPELARFCRWLRDAGFRVFAPILLGTPDTANPAEPSLRRIVGLCISREFTLFASGKASPVTEWLRELAHAVHAECGGPGIGAIGMCLTGGFALCLAADPVMLAPVMSQPSLPAAKPRGIDISAASLARVKARVAGEGLVVRGYRFAGDTIARPERFATLRRELGEGFIGTELPDSCANPAGMKARGKKPHSVFTGDLIDAAGEPTRMAVDDVIAFFHERLAPAA